MEPFFSIVMPAYNAEAYISDSIQSLITQTFSSFELIVIDDASSDDTPSIIHTHKEADGRIKEITHRQNEGPLSARIDGVHAAKGKYILFVDADDSLVRDALEQLHDKLAQNRVDILHFNINVINAGGAPQSDIRSMEAFVRPLDKTLLGDEAFVQCFEKQAYGWNLANKAFKSETCKLAHSKLAKKRLLRGEDAYAYFAVSFFSTSYLGIPDLKIYNYQYGAGEDGKASITLDEFEHMCSSSEIVDLMREFLQKEAAGQYQLLLEKTTINLASHAARQFKLRLDRQKQASGFEIMNNAWGGYYATIAFAKQYWNDPEKIARSILPAPSIGRKGRRIKTVGTYYHHYTGGGTEKVQQYMIALWKKMGYRVVCFVDNEPDQSKANIRHEVDAYYVLPAAVRCNLGNYPNRARMLRAAILESEIDVMIYHYYDSQTLIWDLLLLKSYDIPLLVYYHNSFSYLLKYGRTHFAELASIYKLTDGMITLSEVDSRYWGSFRIPTYEAVSPYIFSSPPAKEKELPDKTVLCLGRIAPDKHTEDIIRIFEAVAQRVPNAKMILVGGSGDKNYVQKINKQIEESPHSNAIEFHGWNENASNYYCNARVLLMASDVEGYPLVLVESMAAQLPVVLFDLPYLSLLRDSSGKGIIPVPFGNNAIAAETVERLLVDDDYYLQMSKQAYSSIQPVLRFPFDSFWNTIFDDLSRPYSPQAETDETLRILQEVFFDTYKKDIQYKREVIAILSKRKPPKDYKSSTSWKIGRAITWIPRFIKRTYKKVKRKAKQSLTA